MLTEKKYNIKNNLNKIYFALLNNYCIIESLEFIMLEEDINNDNFDSSKYSRIETIENGNNNVIFYILKKSKFNNKNFIHNTIIDFLYDEIISYHNIDDLQEVFQISNLNNFEKNINERIVDNFSSLFVDIDLLNMLSETEYEGNICSGKICIKNSNKKFLLEFDGTTDKKINFNKENFKIIRKLLETTSDEISLVVSEDKNTSDYYIEGIAECDNTYNSYIKFVGKSRWVYIEKGDGVLVCDHNNFSQMIDFPITKADKDKIRDFFELFFDSNSSYEKLNYTIEYISKIKSLQEKFHGALIVFTDDAKYSKNMCDFMRGLEVTSKINLFKELNKPNNNVNDVLKQLHCIDGAVLFNEYGDLLSFGVILDGCVKKAGDRSRGSRFNCAKTFTEFYGQNNCNKHYLSIVLSEDGPVNVFSSLG